MQTGDLLRGPGYTITLVYNYSELQQKAPAKKSAQRRGSTFSLRTSCRRSIISSCSCSSSSLPLQLRESKVCKAEGQTASCTACALPKTWGYMAGILSSIPRITMNQNHFEKESAFLCNGSKGTLNNSAAGFFFTPQDFTL